MKTGIKSLSDENLEAIRHLIRRDAVSDLEIAQEAEKRGAKLGETDGAKIMAIVRYRGSQDYARWLQRWENQDMDLKKAVALEKQRFQFLQSLVEGTNEQGLYAASKYLQGRLVTLAARMSDEDLISGDTKWLKGLLLEIRESEKLRQDAARKADGEKAIEVAQDKKLSAAEREARMKEIFGISG